MKRCAAPVNDIMCGEPVSEKTYKQLLVDDLLEQFEKTLGSITDRNSILRIIRTINYHDPRKPRQKDAYFSNSFLRKIYEAFRDNTALDVVEILSGMPDQDLEEMTRILRIDGSKVIVQESYNEFMNNFENPRGYINRLIEVNSEQSEEKRKLVNAVLQALSRTLDLRQASVTEYMDSLLLTLTTFLIGSTRAEALHYFLQQTEPEPGAEEEILRSVLDIFFSKEELRPILTALIRKTWTQYMTIPQKYLA